MTSNYLSVYGVAIAVFYLSVDLTFLYEHYEDKGFDFRYKKPLVVGEGIAVAYLLLLLGIIKKWSWLVLPSILTNISSAMYLVFGEFGLTAWALDTFDDYMTILLQIAVEMTLLYPLCHLFAELRRTNVAAKRVQIIQPTSEAIAVKILI